MLARLVRSWLRLRALVESALRQLVHLLSKFFQPRLYFGRCCRRISVGRTDVQAENYEAHGRGHDLAACRMTFVHHGTDAPHQFLDDGFVDVSLRNHAALMGHGFTPLAARKTNARG